MRSSPVLALGVVWVLFLVPATLAQSAPGSPKPGSEHDKLAFFVGKWVAEASFRSAEGSSQKSTWTEVCQWFEGNYALICHTEGEFGGHPVREISVEAYDAAAKTYVYFETNNGDESGLWRGKLEGNTWTWKQKSSMNGKPADMRFTQTQASADSIIFKLESAGADGAFQLVMDGRKTRQK